MVVGIVSLATVAPGVVELISEAIEKKQYPKKKWPKKKARRSLYYLKRRKLISFSENKRGHLKVQLTKKGQKKLEEKPIQLGKKIKRPSKWDKKWRLVIFDIPEVKKKQRDFFRKELKSLGFAMIGNSAYLHPFDCETEINFLRNSLVITPYVKLLIVLDFEGIGKLKRKFKL